MRGPLAAISIALFLLGGSAWFPVATDAPVPTERIVVVLHDNVADPEAAAADLASWHSAKVGFVYRHALSGFSAEVPSHRINALARDPRVAYVEPDYVFHTFEQALPTGIDRVEADQNPHASINGTDVRVNVDIAIIDTGIDYTHPDLHVTKATDCTSSLLFPHCSGSTGNLIDKNGHGTHVAGIAAALDNDIGVVGVAPGARLWSIKVLDQNGSGFLSWIIAGIDAVTQHADDIDVANMSLGCECSSSALDDAIANSVRAGVVYAVAAGNSAKDASTFSPANHPDVITTSALADFDGLAGGAGEPTCRSDQDDTLADFSNYGPLVDIAAPGVCITSTWLDGGYRTISGTSMASPHVAGAAALYIAAFGRDQNDDGKINKADVDAVRDTLVGSALPQGHTCGYTNERAEEGSVEPLLFVNATALGGDGTCNTAAGDAGLEVSINWPADGETVSGQITITAEASDEVTQVEFFVDDAAVGVDSDGSDGWSVGWDTTTRDDGTYTLTAFATDGSEQVASAPVSVIVANSGPPPPTVSITNPDDGATVSGNVTVTADATGDGIEVEFFVDATSIGTDTDGSDGWSATWDTTTTANGDYTIEAVATDAAGNSASHQVTVTVANSGDPSDMDPNAMYVWDIEPTTSRSGPWTNVTSTVTILRDADTNGADAGDEPVSGAQVTYRLERDAGCDGTYESVFDFRTSKTNSSGVVTFNLKTQATEGCWRGTVLDLTNGGYIWDQSLDQNNPRTWKIESGVIAS
jgi:subtilisin family serine protease